MTPQQNQQLTNTVPLLPPPVKTFNDARQQYMEQYGSTLVTNRYLRVAILCVSSVALGALALNYRTYAVLQDFKPIVIRIDEV